LSRRWAGWLWRAPEAAAGFAGFPRDLSFSGRTQNSQRRACGPPSVLLKHLRACFPENDRSLGLLNVARHSHPAQRLIVSWIK